MGGRAPVGPALGGAGKPRRGLSKIFETFSVSETFSDSSSSEDSNDNTLCLFKSTPAGILLPFLLFPDVFVLRLDALATLCVSHGVGIELLRLRLESADLLSFDERPRLEPVLCGGVSSI